MTVIQVDGGCKIEPVSNIQSIGILYPGERVDFLALWEEDLTAETVPEIIINLDKE